MIAKCESGANPLSFEKDKMKGGFLKLGLVWSLARATMRMRMAVCRMRIRAAIPLTWMRTSGLVLRTIKYANGVQHR